jgi:hypothetical protein
MPIPIEKLRAVKNVVVHEACPDGLASAMILRACYPTAEVKFVQYDTKAHKELEAQPNTIFADFSPHPDRVGDFKRAESIVLDHHKTQKGVVASFGELGVFGDEATEPGVSGAVLAFREVWLPLIGNGYNDGVMATMPMVKERQTILDFATLAGVRDTWQTKSPRWQEACEQAAAMFFWPPEAMLSIEPDKWAEKLSLGSLLLEKQLKRAKRNADSSFRFTSTKGTRVAVFEGTTSASDAAEYLHESVDMVVGFDIFVQDGQPVMLWSVRSHTDFDCGTFCKAHGGGGHLRAAGFKLILQPDDPNPFALARRVIAAYEQRTGPDA